MRRIFFLLTTLSILATPVFSSESDRVIRSLALTPPMGWNSWNTFYCQIDENLIKETADIMAKNGMKEAGYEYINLDDCWQTSRDKNGVIQVDKKRFPSGMKALADYVHSKGLKLGLYSDAGRWTCAGGPFLNKPFSTWRERERPGSKYHEEIDAKTYASWGIDYLKYDFCYQNIRSNYVYSKMGTALANSGRNIVFSLCSWGRGNPWEWAKGVGQLWRTTRDIRPNWKSWTNILDQQSHLYSFAGPGHWNDPDMLYVGALPYEESKAHFALWSIVSAPLIAGNDIRNMAPEIAEILTNQEIIKVNQDSLGFQGQLFVNKDEKQIYGKLLSNNKWAVVLFNKSTEPKEIEINWKDLSLDWNKVLVRDLYLHKNLGEFEKGFKTMVPAHGVSMLTLTDTNKPLLKSKRNIVQTMEGQNLTTIGSRNTNFNADYWNGFFQLETHSTGPLSGINNRSRKDSFNFIHKKISSPFEISSRIKRITMVNGHTEGGLMIRNDLNPNAAFVSIGATAKGEIHFSFRAMKGQRSIVKTIKKDVAVPWWFKINLENSMATAFYSRDGYNWKIAGEVELETTGSYEAGHILTTKLGIEKAEMDFDQVTLSQLNKK